MIDLSQLPDWSLVAYMRTTAHELSRLDGVNPDAAPLLREGADRLSARLTEPPIPETGDDRG